MTRVVIVRHGETEGNQKKIFRGRWDLPLNQRGQWQVRQAGQALASLKLSAVYSSPLLRARQTAQALASHHKLEVLYDEALIDIDFGDWTQQPESFLCESFPYFYRQWRQSPESMVFPNGEGLTQVRARVTTCLDRLASIHPEQNIALASHRVPIKVMLCAALGLDNSAFWRIRVDTASVSVLEAHQESCHLLFSNDTCHLNHFTDRLGETDF